MQTEFRPELLLEEPLILTLNILWVLILAVSLATWKKTLSRELEKSLLAVSFLFAAVINIANLDMFSEVETTGYELAARSSCSSKSLNTDDFLKKIYTDKNDIITKIEFRLLLNALKECREENALHGKGMALTEAKTALISKINRTAKQ